MTGDVRNAHPPAPALTVINPVCRMLLRSRFGARVPSLALLDFTGRRSGRPYSVVVTWHELDGEEYVVSPARWRVNFTGGHPARVLRAGVGRRGRGVLDEDPAHVADIMNRLIEHGEPFSHFGMAAPEGHRLTPGDVLRIDRGVIRFTPAA